MSELQENEAKHEATLKRRRERLAPILAELEAAGESSFLDLCEMLLMLSERVTGMIKWSHPRVLVHIKHPRNAKKSKERKESRSA